MLGLMTTDAHLKIALESLLDAAPSLAGLSLSDFIRHHRTVTMTLPLHHNVERLVADLAQQNDLIVTAELANASRINRLYTPKAQVLSVEELLEHKKLGQLPLRLWFVSIDGSLESLYPSVSAPGQRWIHLKNS